MIEITEQSVVDSYPDLRASLVPLRAHGLRIAIDDAGAGYASLHHIVELRPDFIKVDRSLVHGLADDDARRVAVSVFVLLSLDLERTVVAEGVERSRDLAALRDLGVQAAQGFLLGKPSAERDDLVRWTSPTTGPSRALHLGRPAKRAVKALCAARTTLTSATKDNGRRAPRALLVLSAPAVIVLPIGPSPAHRAVGAMGIVGPVNHDKPFTNWLVNQHIVGVDIEWLKDVLDSGEISTDEAVMALGASAPGPPPDELPERLPPVPVGIPLNPRVPRPRRHHGLGGRASLVFRRCANRRSRPGHRHGRTCRR